MEDEHISVMCDVCGHMNYIPLRMIYDGYEGLFVCENCKSVLDKIHEVLDL